jgi:hypothetical protein
MTAGATLSWPSVNGDQPEPMHEARMSLTTLDPTSPFRQGGHCEPSRAGRGCGAK